MGTNDAVVFRSGNRVGKTTVGAVNACLLATGWHPWAVQNGKPWGELGRPTHGWISSLSWDFVRDVIWPTLEPLLPMSSVARISWRKGGAKKTPDVILLRNGSTITLKTSEQGADKYQGAKLDWLWVDEEHPEDVIEEARARLVDRGGILFVTLTPIQRRRWVRDLEREPGTVVVRASMYEAAEAGIIPMEGVEAFAARLPERQRRVRVYGDQVALEGLVYPEFSREAHCATVVGDRLVLGEVSWPWPLPAEWRRTLAMDFGYANPTAIVEGVRDPFHDRLIIPTVLYAPQIRATLWAGLIRRFWPGHTEAVVCDHDAFARAELEALGVGTCPANKDVDSGLEAVERLLEPCGDGAPGLVLVQDGRTDNELGAIDAGKLVWEFEGYHYPEQRIGKPDVKDAPVKKDDHALDALRYLVKAWEGWRGGPPMPPMVNRTREREPTPLTLGNPEDGDLGYDGGVW